MVVTGSSAGSLCRCCPGAIKWFICSVSQGCWTRSWLCLCQALLHGALHYATSTVRPRPTCPGVGSMYRCTVVEVSWHCNMALRLPESACQPDYKVVPLLSSMLSLFRTGLLTREYRLHASVDAMVSCVLSSVLSPLLVTHRMLFCAWCLYHNRLRYQLL